jgi:putative ABC transport system permease protein
MSGWFPSFRFAARVLFNNPVPTILALLLLALGIGATTTVFGIVDGMLLRALPFPEAERLVQVIKSTQGSAGGPASYPDYVSWRDEAAGLAAVAAYHPKSLSLTEGNEAGSVEGLLTTRELLSVLGVRPAIGRDFAPGEDQPGHSPVALLAHGLWRRRFGGDTSIVGRGVVIDGETHTVIGVLPPGFRFPLDRAPAEILLTSPASPVEAENQKSRDHHDLTVVARLHHGTTIAQARTSVATVHGRAQRQFPETESDATVAVVPLQETLVRDVRPLLLLLLAAVGFVLLIACANVANLLLARGLSRQREMAIRGALGATRGHLVRQLLAESALLGLAGGVAGFALSFVIAGTLGSFLPSELQRFRAVEIDARMMVVALAVSLLTSFAFGLLPAVQATGGNIQRRLGGSGPRQSGQPARRRAFRYFTVMEVALAVALLVGAGLMVRSFASLRQVDPGFRPEALLTASVALPEARYGNDESLRRFYRQLLPRLTTIPGVQAAGIGMPLPLSGINFVVSFKVDGAAVTKERPRANLRSASPDYLRTLRVQLRRGRLFVRADDHEQAPPVMVINETMARRYFGDRDPVGRRISVQLTDKPASHEIIGVVADVHHAGLHRDAGSEMYVPFAQAPGAPLYIAIRTSTPGHVVGALRAALHAVDESLRLGDVRAMEDVIDESLGTRRVGMLAMVLFAVVALVLAMVGVYGMISYSVSQRTHEIGIRMALGAQRRDVMLSVVGGEVRLALIGVALGLGASLLLSRLLSGLLYGVTASDPSTYLVLGAVALAVTVIAAYLPARRAAALDPMVALRR